MTNPLMGASLLPLPKPPARPSIVALGGDGIGPEVVDAALQCLRASGAPVDLSLPPHGAQTLAAQGDAFPQAAREACLAADAILFGACETVSRKILRFLRFELDCYANLRPTVTLPGVTLSSGERPAGFRADLVIVREASEGMYPGREGELRDLVARWPELRDALGRALPDDGRFALRVVTGRASARIGAYAARLAAERRLRGRGPGHVTIVTKENVLRGTDGLFREACEREIAAVGGVTTDHLYVDEAARRLVACPDRFDVLVTTNLFGDVLSDVAAEAMGGLPLAPSAGIGDRCAYFEPVHGSAPDLAGRGVANPAGAIYTAAMLLAYLGLEEHAARLEGAVAGALTSGVRTRDLGGSASTGQFAEAVCRRLA
jgi:isocitrate/isopropylmalate dehydrogenase